MYIIYDVDHIQEEGSSSKRIDSLQNYSFRYESISNQDFRVSSYRQKRSKNGRWTQVMIQECYECILHGNISQNGPWGIQIGPIVEI
mmetsp:Transcript_1281/g.1433  ORF Transcript_1281/g.1433 Transcript_1281/m.1433 type:complete len:87 (+) Transcript_1281:46-306(+)